MLNKRKHSKGFFFVLMAFLMLLYVFAYITAWTFTIDMNEKVSSDKFRGAAVQDAINQMSEATASSFLDVSGHYAFYKINGFASYENSTLKYDPTDEMKYINSSFFSLLMNGSSGDFEDSSGNQVFLNYTELENETYTFPAFIRAANRTLSQAGLELRNANISNYSLEQVDHLSFNLSAKIDFEIHDRLSSISVSRSYELFQILDVSGMPDPLVLRETRMILASGAVGADFNISYKPMFYSPESIADLAPKHIIQNAAVLNGTQGQGFFYGPAVSVDDASSIVENRSDYILVGNFSDIIAYVNYTHFGAYILTSHVEEVDPDLSNWNCGDEEDETFVQIKYQSFHCRQCGRPCTSACGEDTFCDDMIINPDSKGNTIVVENTGVGTCVSGETYDKVDGCKLKFNYDTHKPFIVSENLSVDSLPIGPGSKRYVLFIASSSSEAVHAVENDESNVSAKLGPASLFNIEELRDAVVCTNYYFSERAPSYPRRLSSQALDAGIISPFGIESMLVGRWAGGDYLPSYEPYSRVDFEFFNMQDGIKIRGMPGCKNPVMCSKPVGDEAPLGHFRVSSDSIDLWSLENISCDNGLAGCD
ncbi:hypothetical protein KJ780_01025 [Candidatus Micrarchaeota archaeon]|nr:hypothetical protein [Candidatus Micrarchaeota archaeon]